jgi:hypothetical protein
MAWADDIKNQRLASIYLFEYDKPISTSTWTWISIEAGIWEITVTPGVIVDEDDYGMTYYHKNTNEVIYNIQSFRANKAWFTKVTSMASLRSQNKSFLYDFVTTKLRVHFDEWEYPPVDEDVYFGAVQGFAYKHIGNCYFNNIYYDPRIKSIPTLSRQKDPLFHGLIAFNGGNVQLLNQDAYFDDFADSEMWGQPARVLMGFAGYEYADFQKIFSGYIEDFEYDYDTFTFKIQDARAFLTEELPAWKITAEEFPSAKSDKIDKYIPVAYGEIFRAEPVCVNENDVSGPYQFYICDTTHHAIVSIDAVYADGEEITPSITNLDDGYIFLTSAQCKDGDSFMEILIDFHATTITKGVDIMLDIFDKYCDIEYIAENFNLTEIEAAKVDDRNISLFISDKTSISDIFESICSANDRAIYQQDDGLWTSRYYYSGRTASKTILSDEWIDNPSISYDRSRLLSGCIVKYNKYISSEEYLTHENDTYADYVFLKYKQKSETKEYETTLTDLAGATAKAEAIMERSKEIFQTVKRKTKRQNFDLDIYDFIIAEHSREWKTVKALKYYEVIGTDKQPDNDEIEFTLNEIRNVV